MAATTTETGQVLEFTLGSEVYCVSIDNVTEIVGMSDLTAVPNTPGHVEGVMDLRGRTTTIVNPKTVLNLDDDAMGERIIVFDPELFEESQSVGWVVDTVREVIRVSKDDVDESPGDDDYIEGVHKRDDDFVIWVKPKTLHA